MIFEINAYEIDLYGFASMAEDFVIAGSAFGLDNPPSGRLLDLELMLGSVSYGYKG